MSEIRKVVLYKHGVGYFERVARVIGSQDVSLTFKAQEMNDVLKSLTVFDLGGGTVSSVSYDNQKPTTRLIEESALAIDPRGGAGTLLGTVRGASIRVVSGGRTVTGQVVGLEDGLVPSSGAPVPGRILTIFDDEGGLHSFPLHEIGSVSFLDEHLKKELRHLFTALLSATKKDAKTLKLFARGERERELSISYVVECPVWKTSYRIALAADDKEPPFLQGWALVDNPQDEDWTDVELSLVSGLPISFTHDLYSPRYLKRREVVVATESAAGPVVAEAAMMDRAAIRQESREFMAFSSPAPSAARGAMAPPPPVRAQAMAASQNVEVMTQAVGELFEYRVERPVTVLRNQSALVPIVGSSFEGQRKLLYNKQYRATNPLMIIDLKNTTGLTLEGGPLTVFEGEVYAGEAMLDTLAPDEERMVPYAVDLSVDVKVEAHQATRVTMETLKGGIWCQRRATYQTTVYRFSNKSDKAKLLILEHPVSTGVRVRTPDPVSESHSFWRFAIELGPKCSTEFPVTLRSHEESKLEIRNGEPSWVASILLNAKASTKFKQVAQKLLALGAELHELLQQEDTRTKRVKEIAQEQERLRNNLVSLDVGPDGARLRARYLGLLEAQEDELQALATRSKELSQTRHDLEQEAQNLIDSLDFEELYETGE